MTIQDFLDIGIESSKIIEASHPSVVWNIKKNKLVSHKEKDIYELITEEDGKQRISIKNNRLVSVKSYTKITNKQVQQINNSEGIIVYLEGANFRFEFVPSK